jgi:hypothetical protein
MYSFVAKMDAGIDVLYGTHPKIALDAFYERFNKNVAKFLRFASRHAVDIRNFILDYLFFFGFSPHNPGLDNAKQESKKEWGFPIHGAFSMPNEAP